MTPTETPEQRQALFAKAWIAVGSENNDFPYSIEAELNDLCGEHEWMRAWDNFCASQTGARSL